MSANIHPSGAKGASHIPTALGGHVVTFLALKKNALIHLDRLEKDPAGGHDEEIKQLKDIIKGSGGISETLAAQINKWNTIGQDYSPEPKISDFTLSDGDSERRPTGRPSIQEVLHVVNLSKVLDELSNTHNGPLPPAPAPSPEIIEGLKEKLRTATEEAKVAQQTFVQAQNDATAKDAELTAQGALLTQILAYHDVVSAQQDLSAGDVHDLTFGWNIGNFLKGAVKAIGTGVQIATAVAKVLA